MPFKQSLRIVTTILFIMVAIQCI
ncbi:rhomboid family intramembrane serine protease, partial [Pseudoalteromonas sp. S3178]